MKSVYLERLIRWREEREEAEKRKRPDLPGREPAQEANA